LNIDLSKVEDGDQFVLLSYWDSLLCLSQNRRGFQQNFGDGDCSNLIVEWREGRMRIAAASGLEQEFEQDLILELEASARSVAVLYKGGYLTATDTGDVVSGTKARQAWEEYFFIPLAKAKEALETFQDWREWATRCCVQTSHIIYQNFAQSPVYLSGSPKSVGCVNIVVSSLYGRLGNNIFQFLNAIVIGAVFKAAAVRLHSPAGLQLAGQARIGTCLIEPLSDEATAARDQATVSGQFYAARGFELAFLLASERILLSACDAVASLLPLDPRPIAYDPAQTLVIHIRAGDVFKSDRPHPWYVQPPVAFYAQAALDARNRYGLNAVLIVYEDESNPALDGLVETLKARGFVVTAQSKSLSFDFSTLRLAHYLVQSFGTFAEAAAVLSSSLKCLWAFRQLGSQLGLGDFNASVQSLLPKIFSAKGVMTVIGDDESGAYIRSGQWRCTPEQRELIRELPLEAVRLKYDYPLAAR
jgi:hypothetical protein